MTQTKIITTREEHAQLPEGTVTIRMYGTPYFYYQRYEDKWVAISFSDPSNLGRQFALDDDFDMPRLAFLPDDDEPVRIGRQKDYVAPTAKQIHEMVLATYRNAVRDALIDEVEKAIEHMWSIVDEYDGKLDKAINFNQIIAAGVKARKRLRKVTSKK